MLQNVMKVKKEEGKVLVGEINDAEGKDKKKWARWRSKNNNMETVLRKKTYYI